MCGMWMSASTAAYRAGRPCRQGARRRPSAVSAASPISSSWRTSTSRFTGWSSTTSTAEALACAGRTSVKLGSAAAAARAANPPAPPQRQRHGEGGAGAGRALDGDIAAHQLGQPAHDRQAEPGAAEAAGGRAVGLREGLEQPRTLLRGQPDAGVAHRQRDARAPAAERRRGGAHPHAATLGELQRVANRLNRICRTRVGSPISASCRPARSSASSASPWRPPAAEGVERALDQPAERERQCPPVRDGRPRSSRSRARRR